MDIFGIIGKKKLFVKDHRNAKMPRGVKLRGIKKKESDKWEMREKWQTGINLNIAVGS